MRNKNVDILILSAGKGTRIKDEFGDTPKALIIHKNELALNKVLFPFKKPHNVPYNIYLNVRKDEEEHFKKFSYDLCVEDVPLGNAGAIKVFGEALSDPFIVCHNDIDLKDIDVTELFLSHLQNDAFMTMVVKNIGEEKEKGLVVKKFNKVIGFTRERFVNCGFYCISHKAFSIIEYGFQDIDEHLLPRLCAIHQLSCYEYNGYYEDWGR